MLSSTYIGKYGKHRTFPKKSESFSAGPNITSLTIEQRSLRRPVKYISNIRITSRKKDMYAGHNMQLSVKLSF
jgi:hypothetical protein